jgi:MoaA/NifB/PqqE/SkfB family radical SAM enzyme
MFSYKKFCQRMVAIADIRYIIAIHGHDSSLHDSITRCKSSFNQTVQGIRNLISLGQKVIIKTVISKKNYAHLLDVAKLCDSLGIKEISFAFPHAEGNAWKYFDEVVPKYSEIKDAVSKSIDFCNKKGILTTFETMPYCMMRGHEKHVLDSRICRNEGSQLKQIGMIPLDWDRVRKQIKRKFEKCKRCKYDNTCEGPWKEYADKFGSEEFEPIIS